jgi:hypothetical protein
MTFDERRAVAWMDANKGIHGKDVVGKAAAQDNGLSE